MKTRHVRFATAWAVAWVVVLTGGCGANSVGLTEATPPVSPAVPASGEAVAPQEAVVTNEVAAGLAGPIVQKSEPVAPPVRPEIAEVVNLVNSGAGEDVVRTFVSVSPVAYQLELEDILYLRDIGISDGIIAAMMRRGGELRAQASEAEAMQTNLLATVERLKEAMAEGTPNGQVPAAQAPVAETVPPAPEAAAAPVMAPQAPPDAPEPVQQFYSDLSPYGTWYQVPTYGWVWQPRVVVVDTGWMPYRHGGRWLWTDCGWYWASDYSWGWAPFHYGRWCTYPGLGWCWQPGSVWGPSWVTWRYHGGYVGWAPLPPACGWTSGVGLTWYGSGVSVGFGFGLTSSWYTFVGHGNFCHRNVGRHAIGGGKVNTVYNESTVINNVINGNNNTIINNGVGYEKIARNVRGEVPKASVQTLPFEADRTLRADRVERSKNGDVVYRPARVEAAPGRPATLRAEVRPAGMTQSLAGRPSASGVAARPDAGSQFRPGVPAASAGPGKPVESRGAVSTMAPSAGSRSALQPASSTTRTTVPSVSRGASRTGTPVTTTPKAVESRGSSLPDPGRFGPARSSGTSDSLLGPRRQTTPVPLADPSRNIPARTPSSVNRAAPATMPTAKPAETRTPGQAGYAAPSVPGRSFGVPARSAAPTMTAPAPNLSRPSAAPGYSPASRPSAPARSMPTAPSAPRQSFSAPAPAMSAPRPSFSAPAPAMSAPRPSYSAPAPVMSAPRAPVASPAPSSGAPGSSSSRGGARTGIN